MGVFNRSIFNNSVFNTGADATALVVENYSGYRRKVRWRHDEPVDPTIVERQRRAEFEKAFTEALIPPEKPYELPDAPMGQELASVFVSPPKRSHNAALLMLASYV